MLAALGYEPVEFERADDALAACRTAPARFDAIVLCDAPSSQGSLHLARTLHETTLRTPILVAMPSMVDVDVDALADAGITEILRRPLDSADVAAALARVRGQCGSMSI